jgi:hypothetical protein
VEGQPAGSSGDEEDEHGQEAAMPDAHAAGNSPAGQSDAAGTARSPDLFSSQVKGGAGTRKRTSMDSLDMSEQENSRAAANKRHSSQPASRPHAMEDDDEELLGLLLPDAPPPASQAAPAPR